ncbi:LysR family transcriptional regulator [bacterium]|nr:LysR family transcriptional regulator [bacterium]
MLPSSYDLEYFLAVAETGNMSRASERLGISQPSLSLSIKRLEENSGAQLFIRSRSGVELTRAGKRLVSGARKMLEDWDSLKKGVHKQDSEISGIFTIGCSSSVATFAAPKMFKKLLKNNPALEFRFAHGLSRHICEDIISFKVDIGIVVNPVSHPDLVIRELYKDKIMFLKADSCDESTLIIHPELHQTQDLLRRIRRGSLKFSRTITSTSMEAIASMVEAGIGIGILPFRVAKQCSSKLKVVSEKLPFFEDRHCLVYRADAQKSAAASAIVAAVKSAKI